MKKIILLILLTLLALPLFAGTKSADQTVDATPDAEVQIELIAGKIRIVGWGKNAVRVQGTLNDKWETLVISGDADDISIDIELPPGRHRNVDLDADLEISVPAGVELTFETVSSPLRVRGLTGSVSVESISGSVEIGAGLRELEVESISGSVEVESDAMLDSVEVESISGTVEMRGDLSSSGDYSFSSVSGGITLIVAAGLSADYEIETFTGKIDNDFGPRPEKADFLPALSLSFTVGSGGADITVESVSGSIRLREE